METIAMMSAWNTDSGVAIHAESVGKAWVRMGYNLRVFTFLKNDYHGDEITGENPSYVIPCFGNRTDFLDPRPILTSNYDFFLVHDIGMLPKDKLAKIFPVIRRKAKTVHVVHDAIPSPDPCFYQFNWDAVVYFDIRQEKFLKRIYGDIAHYIPFPCFSLRTGDKLKARKELNLPLDKKIVLVFCRRGYSPYLPALPDPDLKDVLFLILTNKEIEEEYPQVEIRKDTFFPHSLLDKYLFAADAIILHKTSTSPQDVGILSSTAYQCMGSGCPILAPRISDFFYPFSKAILKYSDREELKTELLKVLEKGDEYDRLAQACKEFVERHSPENIAREFIKLFHSL